MIQRQQIHSMQKKFHRGKAILVYGARQVGKTTAVEHMLDELKTPYLYYSGDEPDVRRLLRDINSTQLKNLIGDHKILLIDEAQRIDNIGLTLKLITDRIKNVQVIATGSSAFDLANHLNESLTGRKYIFHLHPLSFSEMVNHHGLLEEKRNLPVRMIYGYYPEIVTNIVEREELLSLITDSYLYKDILMLDQIKKSYTLDNILKALALQIGNEVSYNELARLVELDKSTVKKYIEILEKTFVIFTLPSYSRNIRNELKKSRKIYFYDCGIRNAIIGNFHPLENRSDVGGLWENYILSEKMKRNNLDGKRLKTYFWRTTQQQEIDFLEEDAHSLTAYEFKWNPKKKIKTSKTFTAAYPHAVIKHIHPDNYEEILLNPK